MEAHVTPTRQARRARSAHLMCGMPLWGVTGTLACSYLAYLSYNHVRRAEFEWAHDGWSIATYSVWVLLMVGLLGETRCWRERIFFGLVMANFVLGLALAVWQAAPVDAVREVRVVSAGLWGAAALVSLVVTFSSGQDRAVEKQGRIESN
jgi:hypothetical protein